MSIPSANAAQNGRRAPAAAPSTPSESFGDLGIAPLVALPAVLRDLGVDPSALLARAGLPPDTCEQMHVRIGMRRATHLLHLCVEATGKEHFAVLVGQRFDLRTFGLLGYLMKNESTVHAALRRLVLDLRLHDRASVVSFENLGQRLVGLSYAVCTPDTPHVGLADDTAIMMGLRIMQALCGPKWRPGEVQFAHGAPRDRKSFQQLFGVPVRFDAPRSMVVFERRWLDQPVPGADPMLLALLEHLLGAVDVPPARLTDRVRRLLSSGVLARRADATHVADLLRMSERSLRRHLAEEGSSLNRLAAEARLMVARQLLEETRLPIAEIAATLNYSDVTAFTRAFRGWTGQPPSRWRAARRAPAGGAASRAA